MKKTKILVPAIAVLALGLAASTTATVAWFTVENAAVMTQDAIVKNFTAAQTQHALDAITVVLNIDGTLSTKLSSTDGKYKVWNAEHTVLNSYDITSVSGFYSEMTVSVSKIYLTDDESKTALTTQELIQFAGTYSSFTVTTSGQLAGGDAAPANVTALNAFTIGNIDTFDLIISPAGAVSLSDSTFAVAMRGSDAIYDGSEAGAVTITYNAA